MYWIIGADGGEYGPAGDGQVRRWIAERRANAQTRARAEGASEWVPLGSLPEFAGAFSPGALPPPVAAGEAPRPAAEALERDYRIRIGDCFGRSWDLVTRNFWLLVGASFVAGLIASGGFIPYLGIVASLILAGPMMGGLTAFYLKKMRGQPARFGDIFLGFGPQFGALLAAYLVCMILTAIGFFLLLLPGIYLAVSWMFAIPLVIDRKMPFWDAMELSRRVILRHWWTMFGFALLLLLLGLLGLLVCLVGVVVAAAIGQIALLYAYEDIFNPGTSPAVVIE